MWLQNEIRNDYADCSSLLLSFLWTNFEYFFLGGGEDPYLKVNLCQILCQPNQSWYRLYFLSNSLLDESISDSISRPRHLAAWFEIKNRCAAPLCWKRNRFMGDLMIGNRKSRPPVTLTFLRLRVNDSSFTFFFLTCLLSPPLWNPRRCNWSRRIRPTRAGPTWRTQLRWCRKWCCRGCTWPAPGQTWCQTSDM